MDRNEQPVPNDARAQLENPKSRLWSCLHEAGHVEYALRAGAVGFVYLAWVNTPRGFAVILTMPIFPKGVKKSIIEHAREAVAGGVVLRLLTPSKRGVDTHDFQIFSDECRNMREEDILKVWQQAQADIEKDLRSPAFRQKLWQLAREVQKKVLRCMQTGDAIMEHRSLDGNICDTVIPKDEHKCLAEPGEKCQRRPEVSELEASLNEIFKPIEKEST